MMMTYTMTCYVDILDSNFEEMIEIMNKSNCSARSALREYFYNGWWGEHEEVIRWNEDEITEELERRYEIYLSSKE